MQFTVPEAVAEAMRTLKQEEIGVWAVGGAVRDTLLGRPAHDWDLTVDCSPQRLAEALPGAKPIGGVYGTVSWHGVEITPCRAEADYTDHRHPDTITFGGGLRADLSRRDFTVNAMAWDGETVTDPWQGRFDLANRVLRCVGEPQQRFGEDALRILRLYRFAGTLDFTIEEQTGAAALALAGTLAAVSAPRVRGELEKALRGPRPSALWPLIGAGGLAAFGIPAPAGWAGLPAGENPLAPLDAVPESILCRWWTLAQLTGADARKMAKIFDFGKSFVRDFSRLDVWHTDGMPADGHTLKLRLMESLPFPELDLVETMAALDARFAELPSLYARLQRSGEPYHKEQLRITPAELLVEGVPGRKISEVQRCLLKAVVDTPALNVYPTLAQLAREMAWLV